MKTKRMLVCLASLIVLFGAFVLHKEGRATNTATFQEKIEQVLRDERLKGAITGISIRHGDSGEVVYEKNADLRLVPASNTKLFTGAAALGVLGPEYTFATEVWVDGNLNQGRLNGHLYLKGKGDPTLRTEDLDEIAWKLKKAGVHDVSGGLKVDDTWYDDVRLSEGVQWADESAYYGAQISALTLSPDKDFDAGTVIVKVSPGKEVGASPHITMIPENTYVQITNEATSTSGSEGTDLHIERKHGTNEVVVKGGIAVDDPFDHTWVAISEPAGLVAELFQQSLEKYGIHMKQEGYARKGTPEKAERLVVHHSMTLDDLFQPFMKFSNNGHAEVLVKEMGRIVHGEGSWEQGLQVVEDELLNLDIKVDAMQMRDGSGLSRSNLIPPHQLTQLMYRVQEEEWFPEFFQSLPTAGHTDRMTGGTLRSRMKGTAAEGKVHAKTGTLADVSSLTGYVTTADEKTLIFSIVINHALADDVKEIEDRIAVLLSEHRF